MPRLAAPNAYDESAGIKLEVRSGSRHAKGTKTTKWSGRKYVSTAQAAITGGSSLGPVMNIRGILRHRPHCVGELEVGKV